MKKNKKKIALSRNLISLRNTYRCLTFLQPLTKCDTNSQICDVKFLFEDFFLYDIIHEKFLFITFLLWLRFFTALKKCKFHTILWTTVRLGNKFLFFPRDGFCVKILKSLIKIYDLRDQKG